MAFSEDRSCLFQISEFRSHAHQSTYADVRKCLSGFHRFFKGIRFDTCLGLLTGNIEFQQHILHLPNLTGPLIDFLKNGNGITGLRSAIATAFFTLFFCR